MGVSVDTIISSVAVTLLDTAHTTWPRSELVGYLNEAQRTVCFLKADAYTKLEPVDLVAGTNQQIPTDGVAVFDVTQNIGTKLRITLVDYELLDETNRFWADPIYAQTDVQHWASDPRSPLRFSVAPPNDGNGQVLMSYGATPPVLTDSSGEETGLLPTYQYALECYVLAKAYAKNSKRQDLNKTNGYMNEFRGSLGIKSQSQVAVSPKVAVSEGLK